MLLFLNALKVRDAFFIIYSILLVNSDAFSIFKLLSVSFKYITMLILGIPT